MKNVKKTIAIFSLLVFIAVIPPSFAKADADTVKQDISYVEMPVKSNVPIDKKFTVSFNQSIDSSSLDNIYVEDENSNKVPVNLSVGDSDKKVVVSPVKNYEEGKTYTLYVKDVKTKRNSKKLLKKATKMKFTTIQTAFKICSVDNATDFSTPIKEVELNPTFTVQLSKPIDVKTLPHFTGQWTFIRIKKENAKDYQVEGANYNFSSDGKTVTIKTDNSLIPNTKYTLYIDNNRIYDGRKLYCVKAIDGTELQPMKVDFITKQDDSHPEIKNIKFSSNVQEVLRGYEWWCSNGWDSWCIENGDLFYSHYIDYAKQVAFGQKSAKQTATEIGTINNGKDVVNITTRTIKLEGIKTESDIIAYAKLQNFMLTPQLSANVGFIKSDGKDTYFVIVTFKSCLIK